MKMFPADIWEYPIPKIGNFSFRFLGKTLDEIQIVINVNMPRLKDPVILPWGIHGEVNLKKASKIRVFL